MQVSVSMTQLSNHEIKKCVCLLFRGQHDLSGVTQATSVWGRMSEKGCSISSGTSDGSCAGNVNNTQIASKVPCYHEMV